MSPTYGVSLQHEYFGWTEDVEDARQDTDECTLIPHDKPFKDIIGWSETEEGNNIAQYFETNTYTCTFNKIIIEKDQHSINMIYPA
ncbi:hypothetical protein N7488_011931 [Penicillium malachiteum]|nr:hypothetical protein N7488_011931 [Penicillium malachiteum]